MGKCITELPTDIVTNEVDMPHSFLWNLQLLFRAMYWLLWAPSECFSCMLYVHIGLGWPVRLPALRPPVCSKLLYHVRIGLSVGGSLWYCVWNRRWTITIDSHLANCSTQNSFSAPVTTIFHQLPSSGKIYKLCFLNNYEWKLENTLFPLIRVFSPCLPWLLYHRPMKLRRDFWLALDLFFHALGIYSQFHTV